MANFYSVVPLKWKKLVPSAVIPKAATGGAACFDLHAHIESGELTLEPGQIFAIPTGLAVEIPFGYEMQVRARSGLALKAGLALVNGIGTIDSDYRGEVKVIAIILGREKFVVKNGDRIAQALVSPVVPVEHSEVSDLGSTERGAGGFGSTGIGRSV
jgi:dUTP pyrophosphatase